MRLFATVPFAMEKVTQRELERLGIMDTEITEGRVYFNGDWNTVAKTCVCLRSADRVFRELAAFPAESFDELFDGIREIRWEDVIARDGKINVSAKCARSRLMSVPDTQRIAKKAILTAMERKWHGFPETGSAYPIEVQIHRDQVTVALDCCGEGLHKRGYRIKTVPAPLRETFGAGLLLLSGYRGDRPFLDPFCGSGTLAVEAALIALHRAPGMDRGFVCEEFLSVEKRAFLDAKESARAEQLDDCAPIFASDVSPEMAELTRFHANRAGVEAYIQSSVCDVEALQAPADRGTIVTNPPYGERLGDEPFLRELCGKMRKGFTSFDGWNKYVISGYKSFERYYGIRADKTRRLYNGNIECGLYQYFAKGSREL